MYNDVNIINQVFFFLLDALNACIGSVMIRVTDSVMVTYRLWLGFMSRRPESTHTMV